MQFSMRVPLYKGHLIGGDHNRESVRVALGGIKKYQFRYIANIIPRYYGIPSLKVIVGH